MPSQITIDISPQGDITVGVKGVSGQSCTDLTKKIEDALGATSKDVKTPDFYKKNTQGIKR